MASVLADDKDSPLKEIFRHERMMIAGETSHYLQFFLPSGIFFTLFDDNRYKVQDCIL